MSKILVLAELDLETGDYDLGFKNVSNPGEPIDLTAVMALLRRVVPAAEEQINDDARTGGTGQAREDVH